MPKPADVCLFLEGTYPYVYGGVSTWTHEFLKAHPERTFQIVSIVPPEGNFTARYEIPQNVIGHSTIRLQQLSKGCSSLPKDEEKILFEKLTEQVLALHQQPSLETLRRIIETLHSSSEPLGRTLLLNSEQAWQMLLKMYFEMMGDSSFLNYFWSWRGLVGRLYSILLAELPEANLYHSFSTGYGGLFLTRAYLETGKPCVTTEHGIYTNERRIEITVAKWLEDQRSMNLSVQKHGTEREIKDFWIDTFTSYSRLCYEASAKIITLYDGNKELQVADGADPNKLDVIANGIDIEHYSSIKKAVKEQPTVAFIGRVVPIKDVKCFIHSIGLLVERIPQVRVWIIGPTDEDEAYYQECASLVVKKNLTSTISFLGKQRIEDYLGQIDLTVLTSISEAQPFTILEAGAVGIPCVATNVGACSEMIYGRLDEDPPLGKGGVITPLSNYTATADSIFQLLDNDKLYQDASIAIKKRVDKYYRKEDQHHAYHELYEEFMNTAKV